MPAPAIAEPTKYTARGVSDFYWVVTMANYLSPTRAELNAGTSLKNVINDWSGWSVSSEQIDTPILGNRFTPQIPGAITVEQSSLTVYASKNGTDARQLMPQDAVGYIVQLPGGDTTGYKMTVWPVTVTSVAPQQSMDGADMLQFSYSPSNVPAQHIAVP